MTKMTKRQELFVWVSVMVGIMAIILYACATIGAPPFPEDLCDDFDASQSVILKIATDNNLQLNEIYWGFVNSARLVAAFSESPQETKDFYKLWLNKIREFYDLNYPISLATLIKFMTSGDYWGERVELILAVMSTYYQSFNVNVTISAYDDCMLRAAWSDLHRQLFLGAPLNKMTLDK